jgi:hypothetical protein
MQSDVVVYRYQSIYIYLGIDEAFMLVGYQPPAKIHLCSRSQTASIIGDLCWQRVPGGFSNHQHNAN